MDKTINPGLRSWIEVEKDSDFPIQNLPFGIFKRPGKAPSAATRIGNIVISLYELAKQLYLIETGIDSDIFNRPVLNDFIALEKPLTRRLRECLSDLFNKDNPLLRDNPEARKEILFPVTEVELMMPVSVGDYTDFYSSEQHAKNLGTMFRDADP
jgi:fumarylacetoacetase